MYTPLTLLSAVCTLNGIILIPGLFLKKLLSGIYESQTLQCHYSNYSYSQSQWMQWADQGVGKHDHPSLH